MRVRRMIAGNFVAVLLCAGVAAAQSGARAGSARKVEEEWRGIAAEAKGRVGVAALVIETGEKAELDGAGHFPTQSVYKLPISMALMRMVDEGKISLDKVMELKAEDMAPAGKGSPIRDKFPAGTKMTVRELMRYTLMESDGTASDVLLRLAGGPEAVTNYLRSVGVGDWVVANSERDMDWRTQYDDWCTPEAAVKLLVALEAAKKPGGAVSEAGRSVIMGFLEASQIGAKRIRGMLPAGTMVADKTGTSGTRDGKTAATNDIGLVTLKDGRHIAIAVFVSDSMAGSEVREGVIARVTKAAWEEMGK